jgi:cytochrome c biogenesis protein CcdA
MNKLGTMLIIVFVLFCFFIQPSLASVNEDKVIYAVYFTGVGCPHCANTDPVVLKELIEQYKNLVIIEYEIYQQQINAPLFNQCCENLNLPACRPFGPTPCKGIPLICFSPSHEDIFAGGSPILKNIEDKLSTIKNNECTVLGEPISFVNLDFNNLPGKPKIWTNNKILIRASDKIFDSQILKDLLLKDDIKSVLSKHVYHVIEPKTIPLSGSKIKFEQAISLGGWIFQWNGNDEFITRSDKNDIQTKKDTDDISKQPIINKQLTLVKIISLAVVDAVNPCAFAVLILMLTAILAYNPRNRKNIILAGLAFVASVFIMYLLYGLVIIKFLQLIQALTVVRVWLYKILGVAAVILGILNIKDFIQGVGCKAGPCRSPKERPMTEMPLSWRPQVRKIISGITSPAGAFSVGIFVTLFLLPCTIGPYIIAGGILSNWAILETIPTLLLYNLIFVLPMLIIIGFVYWGLRKVEDISAWKEKNINKLHLVAGIIMLCLGVAMIMGWV